MSAAAMTVDRVFDNKKHDLEYRLKTIVRYQNADIWWNWEFPDLWPNYFYSWKDIEYEQNTNPMETDSRQT